MRAFALKTAVAAFNKPDNNAEKDIAAQIKKEFDKEYTVNEDTLRPNYYIIS